MFESLMNQPYRIIDIMPDQVPGNRAERWFAYEKYCLQPPQFDDIRRRFANLLLKLNCFADFQVCPSDEGIFTDNPSPEKLASWIREARQDLCIVLPGKDAMITLNHDDLYMTVYHPSDTLVKDIDALASAEGLFLRCPGQNSSAPSPQRKPGVYEEVPE